MDILKVIEESVKGNFEIFCLLASLSNRQIIDELNKEKYLEDEIILYLRKKTLCQVLWQYKQGLIKPELLQKWAFLMREGHFVSHRDEMRRKEDPDKWIKVIYESEYDLEHDTERWIEMNEITYRLYEIGDIVDGEIREEELEDWLNNFCKEEICMNQP